MLGPLSEKALGGLLNNDQTEIARKCLDEMETLLEKNTDYGSSALEVSPLAPDVPVSKAIRVQLGHKLRRLMRLATNPPHVKTESLDDTLRDFSGYTKLYLVARDREHAKEKSKEATARVESEPEQGGEKVTSENFARFLKAQEQARDGQEILASIAQVSAGG